MTNMEVFNLVILIVTGLYLTGGALVMHTKNFISGLLFKAIPFFLGLALLFIAIKSQGLI